MTVSKAKCYARLTDALSAASTSALANSLRAFFLGRMYPVFVASLTLVGHLFGLEVITNLVGMLVISVAFFLCDTARPFIPFACMYIFQMSVTNAPGTPTFSDYYMTGWRLPVVIFSFALFLCALVVFILRRRMLSRLSRRDLALLLPLVFLFVAFVLGGAFSSAWSLGSMGFGALEGAFYLVLFLVFYKGLEGEDFLRLSRYFAFVSSVTALVLVIEVGALYLTSDTLFVEGEIVKNQILFGWGIWNSMGVALAVLIPAIFIGVYHSKHSYLYLLVAAAALVGVVLSLSRNAWIFGLLAFAAPVVVMAFVGAHKRFYRVLSVLCVLGTLGAIILLWDRLPQLFSALFNDNGRYTLWQIGIDNFLEAPIFGKGFFGFVFPDDPNYFTGADFIPAFAHQTFVELLSATGIFGLVAYLVYRASTVRLVLSRPSVTKSLLALSALIMLLMSLIDNYVFSFWPVIHYTVALAIVANEKGEQACHKATTEAE